MTIKELIDITKEYDSDTEVRVAMGPWISPVYKIEPCTDMIKNKVEMMIIVED